MSATRILHPYLAGRPVERQFAREMAGLTYDELVAIIARHRPKAPPEAVVASWMALSIIGEALGATRMSVGAARHGMCILRGIVPSRPQDHALLFEHAWTFFVGQRLLAILNRPYTGTDKDKATRELAGDPALSVWCLPSSRCSYHSNATTTFLIMRRTPPPPGMGFVLAADGCDDKDDELQRIAHVALPEAIR